MKSFIAASILLATGAVMATPTGAQTDGKLYSGMGAFIRREDGSYAHSHKMAETIRAREDFLSLVKRQDSSSAVVQACTDTACSSCTTIFSGGLDSNSACLNAPSTNCLIVSDLQNANVVFWNNAGCNGNESEDGSCGTGTQQVTAAGTNSVGVHIGCGN